MNIFTHHKQKSVHSLVASFLTISILVSVLSACNMNVVIPTPIAETGVNLDQGNTNPAITEAFVPPTETGVGTPTAAGVTEIPTETMTEMPAITFTHEPTAMVIQPTEVENTEMKKKEEIVKIINEFLASEGKFTFEEIKKNNKYFFGDSNLEEGLLPLGMIDGNKGQFILLGSNYDGDKKYMHFFLGATDINNNRVVIDYNFRRTFMGRYDELPVTLVIKESSSVSYMGTKIDENMKKLDEKDEWNDFIEENIFKPISISWQMDSQEKQMIKFHLDKYGDIMRFAKNYDLGNDYRIAIFYRLGRYELALTALGLPPRVDSNTEKSNLTCFWDRRNFNGVDSLDNACPSNYEAVQIYIRRPKY